MHVFGFVGVPAVEKHPSGDYDPFADNEQQANGVKAVCSCG
jgi:hypothetical protein